MNETFFIENFISKWSVNKGFNNYKGLIAPYNRTDLQGRNLTFSYVYTNPDTLKHFLDYRLTNQNVPIY